MFISAEYVTILSVFICKVKEHITVFFSIVPLLPVMPAGPVVFGPTTFASTAIPYQVIQFFQVVLFWAVNGYVYVHVPSSVPPMSGPAGTAGGLLGLNSAHSDDGQSVPPYFQITFAPSSGFPS